jgi:hypothetical protein
MSEAPAVLRDPPGAAWEKRGNTVWLQCPGCAAWFPVGPSMLRPQAPPACCPACHHRFSPGAPSHGTSPASRQEPSR